MAHVAIPHISLPFRFVPYTDQRGELRYEAAVNPQNSDEEVGDCIECIIRYPVGYRMEKPAFGTPDQLFKSPGPDVNEVHRHIETWEPRAITRISSSQNRWDELLFDLYINYTRREGA
jgi:hypothetical protein